MQNRPITESLFVPAFFHVSTLIRFIWLRRKLNQVFSFKHPFSFVNEGLWQKSGKTSGRNLINLFGEKSSFLKVHTSLFLHLVNGHYSSAQENKKKKINHTTHIGSPSKCSAVTGFHFSEHLSENPVKEVACLTYPHLFIITEINCLQKAFHQDPASHW